MGMVAIGAWLVTNGHPWFALLVFLMAAGVKIQHNFDSDATDE